MDSAPELTASTTISEREIVRSILVFGAPLVLGMGFHALFNLVDLWIVGKLGTAALAAVTIATMINTLPMVFCNGISTSSIAFIARNIGFRNMRRANEFMRQSFLLVFALSVVLGLIPYIYARELVVIFQAQGPDVVEAAREYLEVTSLGTITMFMLMQITAALRAVGDGVWPMILLVGANILNIALDWGLVFGKWGFPNMGAPGAAYATVAARGVFCLIGFWVLIRGKGGLKLVLAGLKPRLRMMASLIRVGMPSSAQWVVRLLAYLAVLWIIGDHDAALRPEFGNVAQAAFGVGLRLDMFVIFSGFGWGAAASTLVGQNLGRGKPKRASKATWISMWLNVLMMAGMGVAYYLFAPFLIRFFGADTQIVDVGVPKAGDASFDAVVAVGSTYVRVIVFSYVFVAVSIVLGQALNGAGSTRTPMAIDVFGLLLIQLPLAFYLSRQPEYGLKGVWYAIVVSNAIIAMVYVFVFQLGRWKREGAPVTAISREERLLNLLSVLLAARTPLSFLEILGTVAGYDDDASREALDKRFDRDKAALRKIGVPLQWVPEDDFGQSGYRIEKERFFLAEIRFDVEEGIVLAALHRSAEHAGSLASSLRSALTKINVDSPLSEALRDSVAEQHLLDARVSEGDADRDEVLTALGEALSRRRRVRFSYYTLGSDSTGDRVVEPFGIGFFRGHWYLVGRDVEKAEIRVFRVSRIRSGVEALEAGAYEIPGDFDLRQRLGRAPWSLKNGPEGTARIRFAPDVAWMIEENLRGDQRFEPLPDGSGSLVTSYTDQAALVRWIAGYGPAAEVLEPDDLRDALSAHLGALLERYSS